MASARNLLVLNDEAHHAWRLQAGQHVTGVSRQDRDEATKWVGGLDRIQRARGILKCFDFSATPFIPAGDKSPEGNYFLGSQRLRPERRDRVRIGKDPPRRRANGCIARAQQRTSQNSITFTKTLTYRRPESKGRTTTSTPFRLS